MKQKLLNKLWLRVGMLAAIMTTALSGTVWADTETITFPTSTTNTDMSSSGVSVTGTHVSVNIGKGTGANLATNTDGTRIYNGNTMVFTSTDKKISKIVFAYKRNKKQTNGVSADNGSFTTAFTVGNPQASNLSATWEASNETTATVTFTVGSGSGNYALQSAEVTYVEAGGTPTPSISADNVDIEYNATSGSIAYTINNSVEGGAVSAAVTSGDWLTPGTVGATVPFTCSANNTMAARTATVTLTYTYGSNQTTTKNVTVTQAADPNAVNNISDITATGTYTVKGTIVAISNRGFVLGDGTGYVYYYEGSGFTPASYSIGDIKKLSGSVTVYGGAFQFGSSTTITAATESNYVAENPTVLTGSQMDERVASTTPAQLSTYVQYEGVLSVSGTYYNITSIDGASTAIGSISYPISTDFTSLSGKTVKVTGYYVGISSSQYYNTMLGSIEEVTNADPVISASNVTLAYDATSGEITYTIANPTDATLTATSSASWISNITVGEESVTFTTTANNGTTDREATITLSYTGAEDVTVTVTQGHYVADYATLPFEFNGGRADIEDTAGLTQEGLGSDYKNSPYLKLDETGDYVLLKINERPGVLTFDIQGNSFSGGTFTVQTSEDGMTYTNLETYTELGSTQSEEFSNLGENVRYIKWIYTNKSSGNVALGNINLAAYVAPANYDLSVTLSDNINAIYVFDTEDDTNPLIEEGAAGTIQVTNGTRIMVSPDVAEGYQLASLTVDGNDVTSQIDETGAYTFTMPTHNVTITATAEETVVPVTASYVLATSITSGKHYVIANGKEDGTVKVMGVQNNNNRGAVDATIAEGVLSVSDEYEFIIESASVTEGETEVSGYAIYDESGYLYAASSSSNHLKTQETNNANGIWTITFDEESNVASVVAQGSNSRNNMRYNSSSTIFSCYSSGQQDIYLFEKVEAPAQSQSVTVTSAGYATIVAVANLEIPENVEVFAVTVGESASSAQLTKVTAGVPAGKAVLVKASAGTYEFPYASATPEDIADNDLKASDGTITGASGNIYALGNKTKGVGFYKVAAGVTIPAGKAYLEVTTTPSDPESGVKAFYGFEDDATGIEAIDHSPLTIEGAVYNLAGQRLQKMQKGINIVNGKKIAVK